MYIINCSEPP